MVQPGKLSSYYADFIACILGVMETEEDQKTRISDICCSLVNEVLKGDIRGVFIKILPGSFSLCLPVLCINLCHLESQEIYQTKGLHFRLCDHEFSTLNFVRDNIFNVSPSSRASDLIIVDFPLRRKLL